MLPVLSEQPGADHCPYHHHGRPHGPHFRPSKAHLISTACTLPRKAKSGGKAAPPRHRAGWPGRPSGAKPRRVFPERKCRTAVFRDSNGFNRQVGAVAASHGGLLAKQSGPPSGPGENSPCLHLFAPIGTRMFPNHSKSMQVVRICRRATIKRQANRPGPGGCFSTDESGARGETRTRIPCGGGF